MKAKTKWVISIIALLLWVMLQGVSLFIEDEDMRHQWQAVTIVYGTTVFLSAVVYFLFGVIANQKRHPFTKITATILMIVSMLCLLPQESKAPSVPVATVVITVSIGVASGICIYYVVVRTIQPSVKCITVFDDPPECTKAKTNFCARVTRREIALHEDWRSPGINFQNDTACYRLCTPNNSGVTPSPMDAKETQIVVQDSKDSADWRDAGIATLGDYELEWSGYYDRDTGFFRLVEKPVSELRGKFKSTRQTLDDFLTSRGIDPKEGDKIQWRVIGSTAM